MSSAATQKQTASGAAEAQPVSNTTTVRQISKATGSGADEQPQGYQPHRASTRNIAVRWMVQPELSFALISLVVSSQLVWQVAMPKSLGPNPFAYFTWLSHQVPPAEVALLEPAAALPGSGDHLIRYQKGYGDLAFVAFYIVVYSFIRASSVQYIFGPFARRSGITNEAKVLRFTEQGYSLLYWGTSSIVGLYVMSFQDSWWYRFEHLWLKYPHWLMRPELKAYYLLQAAYWSQQAIVMFLKIEKPRKDYYELIAHHIVTLWLVFWSYLVNLTMIGTTVFVAMDVPDSWIATAKLLNYLGQDLGATIVFATLVGIWTYFRIYLSALTLWSVWFEFEKVPKWAQSWNPPQGHWLTWWMKYQIFAPLFLLLLLNIVWWALLWRVLFRAVFAGVAADEREEGEYDTKDGEQSEESKKSR